MKDKIEIYNLIIKASEAKTESALEEFINRARYKQKTFMESESDISGVDYLIEAVHSKAISAKVCHAILPAIVNYDVPFILTLEP